MTGRNSLITEQTPTREQALDAAADALVAAVRARAAMTSRQAAEAAYYPGHPLGSVDAIEAVIVARRAEQPAGLAAAA